MLGSTESTLVVLAGGRATRLHPLSLKTPKCLFPINDKPIIELIIRWATIQGVRHIILALGHLGDEVENHIKQLNFDPNLIEFSYDPVPNYGTANAVKKAVKGLNPNSQIAVVFGDSCLGLCLGEVTNFQLQHGDKIVITALPADLASEPANMVVDKNRLLGYPFISTNNPPPTHADYGLTVLTAHSTQLFSKNDLKLELEAQVEHCNVLAYEVSIPYIEIGTMRSYETSKFLGNLPIGMEWID